MQPYNAMNLSGNLQENLTFVFADPDWKKKVLIGAGVSVVPLLNFASTGYALEVIRNIRNNSSPILPDWSNNWGRFFTDGLKMVAVSFIYVLPLALVFCCGSSVMSAAITPGNSYGGSYGSGGSSLASTAGTLITLLLWALGVIYLVGFIFWGQGVYANYAIHDTFSAAFAFGKILELVKANWPRMLFTAALCVGIGVVLGIVTGVLSIIPCLGTIVGLVLSLAGSFYLILIYAYNVGFVARGASPSSGSAIPSAPRPPSGPTKPPANLGGWE